MRIPARATSTPRRPPARTITFLPVQAVIPVASSRAGVIGALAGTLVSARTPDRLKPIVAVVCGALQIVAAASVLAQADHRLAVVVGVILGLVIFFPMPFFVQLAFIRPGVTPRQIAVTFSIFWAVSYAGSVVIIQVFAWIADATGGLGPGNVPVSTAPMIVIVIVEATFLIGSLLIWRWFRKQSAGLPAGWAA